MTAELPNKEHFKIGEVSDLVGVKPHVLRYWETQFSQLNPKKSSSGHRFYRRFDVELCLQIQQLLHQRGFTIDGARRELSAKDQAADEALLPMESLWNPNGLQQQQPPSPAAVESVNPGAPKTVQKPAPQASNTSEIQVLQREIEHLSRESFELRRELTESRQTIQEFEGGLESLRSERDQLRDQVSQLVTEMTWLRERLGSELRAIRDLIDNDNPTDGEA